MTKKQVCVGRTDYKLIEKKVSGVYRAVKRRWFTTMDEASGFISRIASKSTQHREEVENGMYYIDVPVGT